MSIKEDREEFNTAGLRGVLRKAMSATDEAFIKITHEGHQGELLNDRPQAGSGPYLHFKRGEAVYEYRNAVEGDLSRQLFRVEI